MSEKRFIVFPNNVVWDNQLDVVVCRCILEGIGDAENVCQRLNEQQSIISRLEEKNEQLKAELSECEKFRYSVFKRIEKTIENKDNCVFNKDAKYPCNAYDECLKRKGTNKPSPCMVNWMMGRTFKNMIRKEGGDDE